MTVEEMEKQIISQMEQNPELYAETVEEPVLVIDSDLRTINIPPEIKNLGVESDGDVKRLKFQMPKQYGEFDLSQFDIRVNYMNAKNEGDVYAVEDKQAIEDKIEFSWLVGRNAVAYKGDTQFIVCLKKSDASGIVTQEFNTTVAKLPVLQGLETSEKVVQANPDIIEQMLKTIEGLTQISPEDIARAVEEYMFANPVDVPENLSDLKDDSEHRTVTDAEKRDWNRKSDFSGDFNDLENAPDELPNPNGLIIHIGKTTLSYKGNEAVEITIPSGAVGRIEKLATDMVVELQPNKLYIFPEMSTITYTLGQGEANVANEYHFIFQSGTTPTEVVHPSGINVGSLTVEANRIYEISILEGMLTYQSWAVSA